MDSEEELPPYPSHEVRVGLHGWLLRIAFISVCAGVAAALSLIPFVWPAQREPRSADAIVVLSGDHGERRPRALRLLERGLAPRLIFAGTPDYGDEDELCRDGWHGRSVICLRPSPDSTRAEAQAVGRLARARGWKEIIVVTSTHHVQRARLLFRRCIDGKVWVVGERLQLPRRDVVRQTVREWLATNYLSLTTYTC